MPQTAAYSFERIDRKVCEYMAGAFAGCYNWLILMGDSVLFECAVSRIGLQI